MRASASERVPHDNNFRLQIWATQGPVPPHFYIQLLNITPTYTTIDHLDPISPYPNSNCQKINFCQNDNIDFLLEMKTSAYAKVKERGAGINQ